MKDAVAFVDSLKKNGQLYESCHEDGCTERSQIICNDLQARGYYCQLLIAEPASGEFIFETAWEPEGRVSWMRHVGAIVHVKTSGGIQEMVIDQLFFDRPEAVASWKEVLERNQKDVSYELVDFWDKKAGGNGEKEATVAKAREYLEKEFGEDHRKKMELLRELKFVFGSFATQQQIIDMFSMLLEIDLALTMEVLDQLDSVIFRNNLGDLEKVLIWGTTQKDGGVAVVSAACLLGFVKSKLDRDAGFKAADNLRWRTKSSSVNRFLTKALANT